jgi:hypothetical protein
MVAKASPKPISDICWRCSELVAPGEGFVVNRPRRVTSRMASKAPRGLYLQHALGKCALPGWVYVLPGVGESGDLVKVGCTKKDPDLRAAEFQFHDSVFWGASSREYSRQVWAIPVAERRLAERSVLDALAEYRASHSGVGPGWKEMFSVDAAVAVSVACRVLSAEAQVVAITGESALRAFGIYSDQSTVTGGGSVALDGTQQGETGADGPD